MMSVDDPVGTPRNFTGAPLSSGVHRALEVAQGELHVAAKKKRRRADDHGSHRHIASARSRIAPMSAVFARS